MLKVVHLIKQDPRKGVVTGVLVLTLVVLRLYLNVWLQEYSGDNSKLELSESGFYWINLGMDMAIWLTFYLISACLVGSFGVFLFRLIQNIRSAIKFGILFGASVLLFLICWAFSTSDVTSMDPMLGFTPGALKLLGGMVSYTITLIALGLIGAAGSSVIKVVR
jgi:hypothetical protein